MPSPSVIFMSTSLMHVKYETLESDSSVTDEGIDAYCVY